MKISNQKKILVIFSFWCFLEEFLPPSLANVLFKRYGFLNVLTAETNLYIFYNIRKYKGFNKTSLMVENSTLRRQVFIVFLRELICYNKKHFLMSKIHKKCFVRGSRPEMFCK